jgi:rhamnosyltransferase
VVIEGIARSDICAAVVTFFPEPESAEHLRALAPQVGRILVIDNGSPPESLEPIESAARTIAVSVVRLGSNLGIATALNTGLRLAASQGFRWLATFDQDSRATESMLEEMAKALAAFPERDRVGLVAPLHQDRRVGITVSDGRHEEAGPGWNVIRTTMTSGNLVNIAAAQAVGGFDESLFIDYVDHEFCLRLRRRGYRILEATRAVLDHALGNLEMRSLGMARMGVTHHPALRRYYITRNRMLVWRGYWRSEPAWVLRDMRRFLSESAGIVLFEKDAAAKVRMTLRGIRDASRNLRGAFDPAR